MNRFPCIKLLSPFCAILMLLSGTTGAQELDWTEEGKLLEKGTRKPIQGALINVKEISSISAVSDENGNFVLTFPQPGKYMVRVSTVGESKPEAGIPTPALAFYLPAPTRLPEVVVNAERNQNQVSKSVMSGEELRQIAGSSGDPLKSLQSLPGVAMQTGGGSAPAVRGSDPGDNFYYADSVPSGKCLISVDSAYLMAN